jgi:uracil phosphoribosyltransferase
MSTNSKVTVLQNKSLLNLFTRIRDKETSPKDFAFYADRLMTVLAEETIGELPQTPVTVYTPCSPFNGEIVNVDNLCAVSIIRAGDSLLECFRSCLPGISVGKILIQRDESKADKPAVMYYSKLPPDVGSKTIILCDPMLATGGSTIKAIESLLEKGVKEENIVFSNVVSCPEGLANLAKAHPLVRVVTACVDEGMNEDKYIVPGLGDYGDRYFNTV